MGNPRSSSILAVSDRGVFHSCEFLLDGNWVYSWEFLLDGDPMSSSILAVSDRGVFHSWEFLLDGNFCKLRVRRVLPEFFCVSSAGTNSTYAPLYQFLCQNYRPWKNDVHVL